MLLTSWLQITQAFLSNEQEFYWSHHLKKIFVICASVFACMYTYKPYVSDKPEVRNGWQIPWNWSYEWLWTTSWLLRTSVDALQEQVFFYSLSHCSGSGQPHILFLIFCIPLNRSKVLWSHNLYFSLLQLFSRTKWCIMTKNIFS